MPVISIPKPLRDKLGEEATEALTEVIRAIDLDARKDALAISEERFERRLTEEIGKVNKEIGKVRVEMHEGMGRLRAEIIKWMFIFWMGQIAVPSGIIFAIVR